MGALLLVNDAGNHEGSTQLTFKSIGMVALCPTSILYRNFLGPSIVTIRITSTDIGVILKII
jgi:hypothetical protein